MNNLEDDIEKLVIEDHERDIANSPSTVTGFGLGGFADLVKVLGTSTKTTDKLEALVQYFAAANDHDKVWVIALFSGRKPRRAVNTTQLITWCVEVAQLPGWLFGESYHTVGDLAETIALLLPETVTSETKRESKPLHFYIDTFRQIEKQDESIKKQFIIESWNQMNQNERFVFNKLITGAFRIGVSQKMMVNALAKFTSLE
ncbi:MAG: ATP-dependent DNA ligase, partial [Bacteroidota bacterium]|nr:ATP-dependent DNA ligase [Bacteroidota bacterium]